MDLTSRIAMPLFVGLIISALGWVSLSVGFIQINSTWDQGFFIGVLFIVAAFIASYMLASISISVTDRSLIYKTAFREREVQFSDIVEMTGSVNSRVNYYPAGGGSVSARLIISILTKNSAPLYINPNAFNIKNLSFLVSTISNANPGIKLDQYIDTLKRGDYKVAQAKQNKVFIVVGLIAIVGILIKNASTLTAGSTWGYGIYALVIVAIVIIVILLAKGIDQR